MRRPRRLGDIVFQGREIARQNALPGDENIVMVPLPPEASVF